MEKENLLYINSCVAQEDIFNAPGIGQKKKKKLCFHFVQIIFLKIMAWQNPQWRFKGFAFFFFFSSPLLVCPSQCEVLKLTKTHGEFITQDFGPHTSDFSSNRSISRWVLALRKSTKITIIMIKDNGKSLAKSLLRARASD